MPTFDPLAGLDGVRTYQERVMVRAVRLTRENGEELARRTRKIFGFTHDGQVVLTDQIGSLWAVEGDMIVVTPGRIRVSCRIPADFRAWYSHAGERISEEDLEDDN